MIKTIAVASTIAMAALALTGTTPEASDEFETSAVQGTQANTAGEPQAHSRTPEESAIRGADMERLIPLALQSDVELIGREAAALQILITLKLMEQHKQRHPE